MIGGGPIGLELAQAHRRLGAEVTVLQKGGILPKDDPELVAVVRDRARRRRRRADRGRRCRGVARRGGGDRRPWPRKERPVEGSDLLVAAGRQPMSMVSAWRRPASTTTPSGVTMDARLRTTNRRVFAVGDVAGGLQFTHIAGYHAGIVIRNVLFRLPAKAETRRCPG